MPTSSLYISYRTSNVVDNFGYRGNNPSGVDNFGYSPLPRAIIVYYRCHTFGNGHNYICDYTLTWETIHLRMDIYLGIYIYLGLDIDLGLDKYLEMDINFGLDIYLGMSIDHSPCCIHIYIYVYIYIGHLKNYMKLDLSQFIYYPKRAELLFA
jgi:hypothetical protein